LVYLFDEYSLDSELRELRRGPDIVSAEPQVFDLLTFLIRNRGRVVSKEDLLAEVWNHRIVSDSTVSSRITAARHAVGDSGAQQRLIRTMARRGFRFVGVVRKQALPGDEAATKPILLAKPNEPGSLASTRPDSAERRQLTIMVCNVVETATLSARVDPEELREIIDKCYGCIRAVVERHGGYIAKYTDDGVVVYFGYPQAHEDDAERAVRTGLVATNAISELGSESLAKPLQARVGIATGLVLIGNSIGADQSAENAVVGETPYVAARLQGLGDPGEVVISASTRELVGNLFDYEELKTAQSNGTAGSIAASVVLGESAIASRFEALRPSRNQLIGRDEETKLLLRRWNQAKAGETRVILIWGEPGIGKSHLVAAFQDAIRAEPHTCMRYFCSPHRIQTALHPVITQLEHAAGFTAGDGDDAKLDKLERLLALSSRELGKDVALFAELLSVSTVGRYGAMSLSAQRRKELLLESFIAQLVGLAARQPVLMVLEDAHWIDPTTRELFDIIIDRARDLRVLLIMTYRPEFSPPWLGQSHVTALTLNRLDRSENAALIKQVAGGKDLPHRLREQIITRTDGIPLFIEEVTKSVLESGILRAESGAYVLEGPLPVVAVPSSLQASLIARLDRIGPTRVVVQTSAALGREFRYAVLKAVTLLPDTELETLLDQLVTSELVHRRGDAPHAVYAFKHVLVQDAAYETIPKSQRPSIHRRIAEVFEQQFPDIAEHHPDVLAYHCAEAGLAEKAIDFSIKAAHMAVERSAGVEALAQVETAMALLPKVSAESTRQQIEGRLYVALGDALVMTKGFASPEVMSTLSRARHLLDETDHPIESLRALCGLFNYHLMRSESPACLALTAQLLKRRLDQPTADVVHYLVGTAHLHLGNFRKSIHHLETALSLYEEDVCRSVAFVGGYHLRSFTLIWLGLGYLYSGSLERAAETISAAVEDARSRSHPFTLVSALLALARFLNHTHDVKGAIDATEEGLAIATEQRSPYHVSRANVLRAANIVASGRAEEGITLMEHALAAHRETGANFQSSYNLSRLAEAYARAGKIARAVELADQAVAEVSLTGELWWEAEALRSRGEILLRANPGQPEAAERCFKKALTCARRQEAKLWELQAAQSLAGLWLAKGRREEARELLAQVYATFADGFDIANLKLAKAFLDQLARPVGRAASRGGAEAVKRGR
jgi:class 3 adenylate cyclase/tetratricopeptide (TPR) repeat protein